MDLDRWAGRADDVLVYGLAALFLLAAAAKTLDPGPWAAYLPGWATALVPLESTTLMHVASVGEAAIGIALALRYRTALAAGLGAAWLAGITVAVASLGIWDIAIRDLGLVLFALGVALNELRA